MRTMKPYGAVSKLVRAFHGFFGIFGQASRRSVPIYWLEAEKLRGTMDGTSVASRPGMIMMRHRLRIFTGEDDTAPEANENVTVRLGDISRALIDATRWNRTWVSDFADDEVQVSSDLFEILSAYMRMRPGA